MNNLIWVLLVSLLSVQLLSSCTENHAEKSELCKSYLTAGLLGLAIPLCEELADSGDVEIQRALGAEYLSSNDEYGDIEKGVYWLSRAGEGGDIGAYAYLGVKFEYDPRIKDVDQAIKWYTEGVKSGNLLCYSNLGRIYYEGIYVKHDLEKAYALLQEPAEHDIGRSRILLKKIEKLLNKSLNTGAPNRGARWLNR